MHEDKLWEEFVEKYQRLTPADKLQLAVYVQTMRLSRMMKTILTSLVIGYVVVIIMLAVTRSG